MYQIFKLSNLIFFFFVVAINLKNINWKQILYTFLSRYRIHEGDLYEISDNAGESLNPHFSSDDSVIIEGEKSSFHTRTKR